MLEYLAVSEKRTLGKKEGTARGMELITEVLNEYASRGWQAMKVDYFFEYNIVRVNLIAEREATEDQARRMVGR